MKAFELAEGGGVAAQVDGDVPDVTGEDADEFPLGFFELIMQPTEDAFGGSGLIVLDELSGEAGGGEGIGVEELGKPAAFVAKTFGLAQLDITQRCIENLHPRILDEGVFGGGGAVPDMPLKFPFANDRHNLLFIKPLSAELGVRLV